MQTRISKYIIRNYQPGDFQKYASFVLSAGRRDQNGRLITGEVLGEMQQRPGYNPKKDLFLLQMAEKLVGYTDISLEQKIERAVLEVFIHPDYYRKEIALALLESACKRARKLEARQAHVSISESDLQSRRNITELGFQSVRRFKELEVSLARINNRVSGNFSFRHLQPDEESLLTRVQNSCFTGSWGYNPNTVEEIVYRINLGDSSPKDVILALHNRTVAGYCWTRSFLEEKRGQIFMLGVIPEYRGRGAGKDVLLKGLSYLRNKGFETAELTVDSHNKAAGALYESLGFTERMGTLWYEKKL